MVVNRKVTGTALSVPAGLFRGALVSTGITAAGSVLAANLVLREVIPERSIGYCSMIILLVSSYLGAWVSAGKIKHRRLYVCALSGAVYYALLLTLTALFFGGRYQGMGVTALVTAAGCMSAALVGLNGDRRREKRRFRSMSR